VTPENGGLQSTASPPGRAHGPVRHYAQLLSPLAETAGRVALERAMPGRDDSAAWALAGIWPASGAGPPGRGCGR
jgi:hypothetical protein